MQADARLLQGSLFFLLLIGVCVCDIRTRQIPDSLQAGIAALSLFGFETGNLAGILCMAPYLLVALCSKRADGIGGGDVKLAGATGLVLGLSAGLAASLLGLSGFVVFSVFYQIIKHPGGRWRGLSLPLGPFLAAGSACAYLMKLGGVLG